MASGGGAYHRKGDGSRRQRTAHADGGCLTRAGRYHVGDDRRWRCMLKATAADGGAHHKCDGRQRLLPAVYTIAKVGGRSWRCTAGTAVVASGVHRRGGDGLTVHGARHGGDGGR